MPTKRRVTTTVSAMGATSAASGSSSDITTLLLSSLQSTMSNSNHHNNQSRMMIGSGGSSEGSLALPLLEGLCRRPGAVDFIIKDAFNRWKAGRLIARTFETLWLKERNKVQQQQQRDKNNNKNQKKSDSPPPSKRRRRDKKQTKKQQQQQQQQQKQDEEEEEEEENKQFEQQQQQQLQPQLQQQPHRQYHRKATFLSSSSSPSPYRNSGGSLHWLIKSLASPAVRERRVSFQILAMGCPMDDASVRILIEIIVQLIREGNPSCDSDATCMVGWVTLLKYLVVQVLSGPERLAYCVCPDIGLAWLCRAIWKVSSQYKRNAGTTRVFLLLVDLVHSLVLSGTDDTIYQIHKVLWSERQQQQQQRDITINNNKDGGIIIGSNNENDDDLTSPLACLMGTYHLWREHPNKKSMEKYTTMMKQLIDPSLLPKIVVSPSSADAAVAVAVANTGTNLDSHRGNKCHQRLATFLRKPTIRSTSSSIATTNNKNKSSVGATTTTIRVGSAIATAAANNNNNNIPADATAISRSETNESGSSSNNNNNNNNIAGFQLSQSSPAGSIPSMLGSPPADRSMVASVARLFSSLYGVNSNATTGGGEDSNVDIYGGANDSSHIQNHDEDHNRDYDEDVELLGSDDDENENNETEEDKDATTTNTGQDDNAANKKHDNTDSNTTGNNDNKEDDDDDDKSSVHDIHISAEDDEVITSDEGEDCEDDCDCEDGIIDMDDDDDEDEDEDEDHDEIMIHEDELPQIEQGLLELQRDYRENSSLSGGNTSALSAYPTASGGQGTKERSQLYVKAAMEVLAVQHPPISKSKVVLGRAPLTVSAEKALMSSIMHIVKPEKKPLNGKIILRRAPTQEEFFRGNLSKNPVSFSMLKSLSSSNQDEPTVRDLRQHIATDLQMGDSAELIEIMVANKILDVDLKLRVILQTVWKDHLLQHSGSSASTNSLSSLLAGGGGRGGARSFLSSSSGLSLMLYSSLERSVGGSAAGSSLSITAETPATLLPPMIMTYRLTGVDGEATEDTVSNLNDPEAPSESSSPEEMELLMEKEYGITRIVMTGRGVFCLLRSVESNIMNTLQSIRRDGVGGSDNHTRNNFKQSFYPGLSLLVCCSKLPSNRKLLLQTRAPTTLLRLLLDVLEALEIKEDSSSDQSSESNATAKGLQELIEVLTSDILLSNGDASTDDTQESEADETSTLRLLIQAIETSSLSRPLRNVIAKLVPYLTYGKPKLSKDLASEFMSYVDSKQLGDYEGEEGSVKTQSVLMDTFIHASISLPANDICNSLRMELLTCGFVERILKHILCDCPTEPPSWSPSLWSNGSELSKQKKSALDDQWKEYAKRPGVKTCFGILVGLSKAHDSTQAFLGQFFEGSVSFFQFCNWLESTSDNTSAGVSIKSLGGLLAETLLDDIAEFGKSTAQEVRNIRRKTRDRKKEIAMDRRKKSLMSIRGASANPSDIGSSSTGNASAPFWAPVLDLFRTDASSTNENEAVPPPSKRRKKSPSKTIAKATTVKPAWMEELENMEDETGLTVSFILCFYK
jgi:hypothetical protein